MPTACPLCGLRSRAGDLCPGCLSDLVPGVPGAGRCLHCAVALDSAEPGGRQRSTRCDACAVTHARDRGYDRTIAVIDYAYPGDMLIRKGVEAGKEISALKERGRLDVAALLGRLLAQAIRTPVSGLPLLGAIVPVPSSPASLRRRGFNPAGEIARAVSRGAGVPLRRGWLACVRSDASQKTLGRRARWRAPAGNYEARVAVPAVWVGLVDDVMTTGSTLHFAATALRTAGAAGVVALVAARTPARLWHNVGHVRRDPGPA